MKALGQRMAEARFWDSIQIGGNDDRKPKDSMAELPVGK